MSTASHRCWPQGPQSCAHSLRRLGGTPASQRPGEKFSCVLGEGAPEDDNIALANADVGGARQAAEAVQAGGVPAQQWCFGKATARVFVRDESAMDGLWAMRRAEMERRAEAARKAREEAERLERERQGR